MHIKTGWRIGFASLVLIGFAGFSTAGEEPPKKAVSGTETAKEKPAAKPERDPLAAPADATPKQLIDFLAELSERRPVVRTKEEKIDYLTRAANVMMEVTEKVLAVKNVEDDIALEALIYRFDALELKGDLGQKDAFKLELQLAKKYSTDPRKSLAKVARQNLLFFGLKNIKDAKVDEQESLLEGANALVKGDGQVSTKSLRTAVRLGQLIEESGDHLLIAKAYERFSETLGHTGDEDVESEAQKMKSMAKRWRLVGSPIEIEGSLVDGKPIDWSSYKGKVVLIDFWATWCGPCIEELPNVVHNYRGYHSKGFEVVGVSLDDDQSRLKKFLTRNRVPWANLFSTDEKATGMDHPLAVKYGIMFVPSTILVGKDGNVLKINVRGKKLQEALEELLGPPDEAAIKAAEAAQEEEKAAAKSDEKEIPAEKKE